MKSIFSCLPRNTAESIVSNCGFMIIRDEREPVKLMDQNEASLRFNVYFRDEDLNWYYKEVVLSKRGLIKVGGRKDGRFHEKT